MTELFDTGYRRSPADHRDYDYRRLSMRGPRLRRPPRRFRVDKRTPLPVYRQTGPSCVGWSLATGKTSQERFDKRRTVRMDGQELYSHIALPDGGAYLREGLRVTRELGMLGENGVRHRIASFAAVDPRDRDAVRHAVFHGRGVLIGFRVTRLWAQGGGAEFTDTGGEVLGGHGMWVPQYDERGPGGLNTWGEDWADRGRALLPWTYWDRHVWECWALLDVND